MSTITDVARAAGVSPSTVSRYVNGHLSLSPATEKRVLAAVERLGYVANAHARNLVQRRSGVVGLVMPDVSNPYFGTIADGIVDAAERHGLMVLLCSTRGSSSRQSSYIDLLSSGATDGMLYLGGYRSNPRLAAAVRDGLAVVVLDEPIADLPPVHTVVMDDYAGGYQATSHLAQMGHRTIAYVSGPAELGSVQERRRGYVDALLAAGLDPESQLWLPGQFTEQFGMSALPHLLAAPTSPTAAFVASDHIALGVFASAEAHGVRIPEDLSVVGFDDIRFSAYLRPRLTTVRSPLDRLAQTGIELLLDRMESPHAPARMVRLPVELVIRESVALRTERQPAPRIPARRS